MAVVVRDPVEVATRKVGRMSIDQARTWLAARSAGAWGRKQDAFDEHVGKLTGGYSWASLDVTVARLVNARIDYLTTQQERPTHANENETPRPSAA